MVGSFIRIWQNATATDGYEYRQPKRLCLYPKSWHMAPDSLSRLSKQLLHAVPPAIAKLCQGCPNLEKNLLPGDVPVLEAIPLSFEQQRPFSNHYLYFLGVKDIFNHSYIYHFINIEGKASLCRIKWIEPYSNLNLTMYLQFKKVI